MAAPTLPQSYPSPELAAQAGLAASFKAQQDLMLALAIRQILAIWKQMNLGDVRSSWPAIRVALAALVRDEFARSAQQGAVYYLQARGAAGVFDPPFAPPAVEVPDPVLITATLDSTGPYNLLAKIKAAQPLPQAVDNTAVQLSGAASRLIANGARQAVLTAVQEDPKAVAWMRVTAPDCCAFCAMLASRGAVFKTEQAASFQAHDHCRCTAQPAWSERDVRALANNDLARQWGQATRGYSGKAAIRAWRRYWDSAHPDAFLARSA